MLVTVLMSVYNSDKYLEEAIKSILNQSYKEFEFLIVDDGSQDTSLSIIKRYAELDRRIVLIVNETNLGLASALNKGIGLAKGTYIARQDADDCSTLDRLEKQMKYFQSNPEVDVVGSNCFIIDINGKIVYENRTYSKRKDHYHNLVNCKAIFPHGSVVFKKDKVIEAGLYDSRFYYSQDGELWLRLVSNNATIYTMEQSLYYYRSSPRAYDKKYMAQCRYNKIKQMMIAKGRDDEAIASELEKVRNFLKEGDPSSRPFYMADYWKSLANGTYFSDGSVYTSYRYIFMALKEENSWKTYLNSLGLCFMYLIPFKVFRSIFKADLGI